MAPKSAHVIFAFLSLVAVVVPILAAPVIGGWQPIEKPNDDKVVVDVAKSAVAEYNKEKNRSLIFVSVVKGEEQAVAGTNYRLVISAKDGKATGAAAAPYNYVAVVWSKLDKSIQLISFEKEVQTHF